MRKHKNFINLQLYAGEQDELAGTWVFNDNAYDVYTNKTFNVTFVSNGQTFNSIINNNNPMTGGLFYDTLQVVNPDNAGTFIDQNYQTITITSKLSEVTNGNALLAWLQARATKQSTPQPTLTFKHFYDAGTIGSGTVKFRHYSQQEPSSGETWVLNESPSKPSSKIDLDINFTSNDTNFSHILIANETGVWRVQGITYGVDVGSGTLVYGSINGWSNTAYRTLILDTPPTGDLLTWLQANGTKQGGGGQVIKAGTYQFIEEPNVPIGTNIDENLTAIINTLIDNDVYGNQKTTTRIAVYRLSSAEIASIIIFNEEPYYQINIIQCSYDNEDGDTFDATTDSSKLRTIIITTDQTVSNELYKWAITDGNLVKLS